MLKFIYNIWLNFANKDNDRNATLNQNILSPSEDVLIRNYYNGTAPQESVYVYPDTWVKGD